MDSRNIHRISEWGSHFIYLLQIFYNFIMSTQLTEFTEGKIGIDHGKFL